MPIDESDETATTPPSTTTTAVQLEEPRDLVARPLKQRPNHRSTPAFSTVIENPSRSDGLRVPVTYVSVRSSIETFGTAISRFLDLFRVV